jgi:hypothetical protein
LALHFENACHVLEDNVGVDELRSESGRDSELEDRLQLVLGCCDQAVGTNETSKEVVGGVAHGCGS